MLFSTTETIPEKESIISAVTGSIVQAKQKMLSEARNITIERLAQSTADIVADAIVGIRFTTSTMMDGSSEIRVL
jgi:uncharacterized protein YbjQ (UPF0145 family)